MTLFGCRSLLGGVAGSPDMDQPLPQATQIINVLYGTRGVTAFVDDALAASCCLWLIEIPTVRPLLSKHAQRAQLMAPDSVGVAICLALEHRLQLSEFPLVVLFRLTPALAREDLDGEHGTLHVVAHKLDRNQASGAK